MVAILALCVCFAPAALRAQQAKAQSGSVPSLVTQPVNNAQRIILKGNVHPLARPEYDHGLAPDSLPMNRMLLLLKRSPQQEAALANLLIGQQEKSSPQYHHWLTPQQFGQEFGPSNSDLQAVTDWLGSQGFQVDRLTNGRTVIEFSGSAGLVRQVLRTEIHQYVVKGKSYWANSANPQIPAALAPVVAGIASLNSFPRQPMNRPVGVFSRSKKTGKITPLYTIACPQGYTCSAPNYYGLGPADFATIYNVQPLWNAGTDGTGETIAIVSNSNIDPQDVANFRSMFGLPPRPVNVILDGPDPGIIPGPETEADADLEWAGAVAKNSTIDLVVSEDTEATAGVDLSALYIVDNNLASVLSESYGACESDLGTAGNAFESAMWEQAAAEGITVLVSSGDNGPAGCDYPGYVNSASKGLAVSGLASTPFNVAVGGTDFDKPSTYFNTMNDSTTQNSAKSYVPEIPWNDSCARGGNTTGCSSISSSGQDLVAGSGGVSNCAVKDASGKCSSGYAKPAWQTGTGVPGDSLRDIPDISLFAGDGLDDAFYIVCSSDQTNLLGSGPASCSSDIATLNFLGVGGTSLTAPAFAGIMALVNQKTGERQGNANFVLYPLAAAAASNNADCASDSTAVNKSACVFYDVIHGHDTSGNLITPGTNSVACAAGSPNCNAPAGYPNGILVNPAGSTTPAWTTATAYDLATGLGSVNVTNLVNNWASVSFHPSGTTLGLSPTSITHGQPVTANISVTSSAGTPTGDVELMGNPGGNNIGIATFKLGSGGTVSASTSMLPGGTYNVFAHYAGDGTSGSSDSAPPIAVTVNPENSISQVGLVTFDLNTGQITNTNATTAAYGSPYILRADVLNSAGNPCLANGIVQFACPTGSVNITANGQPLDLGTYSLNSQGYTEDQPVQFAAGSYALVASYSGDNSYNPSTSPTRSITITKAPTTTGAGAPIETQAGSISFSVRVDTKSNGAGPGGTVQIFKGPTPLGNAATCQPIPATSTTFAFCQAIVTITLTADATLTATYSGDSNYAGSTSPSFTIKVVIPTTATLTTSPSGTLQPGTGVTLTAVVIASQNGGPAPTGTVKFFDIATGASIGGTPTYKSTAGTSTTPAKLTATLMASFQGSTTLAAEYSGDSYYVSSIAFLNITVFTTTTTVVSASPANASPGTSLTLTAVVKATHSAGPAPTGTVTFMNGPMPISGTPTITSSQGYVGNPGLPATLTATLVTTFASQANVTASYSGDPNYGASTSPPITVPSNPDFTMSTSQASYTVKAGGEAAYSLDLSPVAGFNQTVSLACAGAPAHSQCTLGPSSVMLNGTNSVYVTVTVSTTAASLEPPGMRGGPPPPGGFSTYEWWIALLWLMMMSALGLAFNQRRRRVPLLASAVLLAAIAMSCGGGGGSSGGGGSTITNPGTPKGTYTLTVTGTSGSLQHQTTVQLTVQ